MPIVDGFRSTKMIRSFEKTHDKGCLSARANANGRIPIFAVSASLVETHRVKYMEDGFDGWILKPVNFQRVDDLLKGIVVNEVRGACVYQPGQWERGGWFENRNEGPDSNGATTVPSGEPPTAGSTKQESGFDPIEAG